MHTICIFIVYPTHGRAYTAECAYRNGDQIRNNDQIRNASKHVFGTGTVIRNWKLNTSCNRMPVDATHRCHTCAQTLPPCVHTYRIHPETQKKLSEQHSPVTSDEATPISSPCPAHLTPSCEYECACDFECACSWDISLRTDDDIDVSAMFFVHQTKLQNLLIFDISWSKFMKHPQKFHDRTFK